MIQQWIKALKDSAESLKNTRVMVACAMLLALGVALNATVAIYLNPTSRITFGLLAFAVCGYLFGPSPAMLIAGLADIVVFVLRPTGPYFPGYTLTAALSGLTYGLAFYQKDMKLPRIQLTEGVLSVLRQIIQHYKRDGRALARILVPQGVVSVLLNLVLNTVWAVLVQGRALAAILPIRLLANAIGYLIYVIVLILLLPVLKRHFKGA